MSDRQVRILTLDGGGVRGLSTLLVLRELLCKIGQEIHGEYKPVLPKDIFDVIVGTSTGGLIALMIVKLNLDVDQAIAQYRKLSRQIFGKPNKIGKWSGGFARPRYSGKLVRQFVVDLIRETQSCNGEDLMMEDRQGDGGVHCSVVCREMASNWKNTRKSAPVFLCSHKCRTQAAATYRQVKMCDAACATSAAPTYFESRRLLNKTLVDGGFGETNNPSTAALEHYRIENRSWSLPLSEKLLWLNIGTGSPQPHTSATESKRPLWTWLIPNFILEPYHLMNDMQKMACDSEQVVKTMILLSKVSNGNLQYHRFSPNNGLHLIGLDDYEKVDDGTIDDFTQKYLDRPDIQAALTATAHTFATEYKARRVATRKASVRNSPIPRSPLQQPVAISPLQQPVSIISPTGSDRRVTSSPIFPDDLSVSDLPELSRNVATDEAPSPPRTPQPGHAFPAPVPKEMRDGGDNTVVGSGQQFLQVVDGRGRPSLTIRVNDESVRGE